jgi:hypothetical protein
MAKLDFNLLKQEIDYVINNQAFNEAFECYNLVKNWIDDTNIKSVAPEDYRLYQNYLIELKFLALNFFDINEYPELIKNYANLAFEIPGYNLWEKLETEIIAMEDINQRDEFKKKIKLSLEQCLENLTALNRPEQPRKISEWIKDFIINLGIDEFDKLKKAEYLANSQSIKNLSGGDKEKVKELLGIYENLSLSSKLKEGYENSVLMNIDGSPVIFHRGKVEELRKIDVSEIDERKTDDVLSDAKPLPAASNDSPVETPSFSETPTIPEKPKNIPRTTELEEILDSYSPASLEYKAISQEIMRLKKTEARKNAKR